MYVEGANFVLFSSESKELENVLKFERKIPVPTISWETRKSNEKEKNMKRKTIKCFVIFMNIFEVYLAIFFV